ncbi:MAG: hybrid sensor histidine kinase/response regulator, partial [Cyanobacteria bacterium]|nr:hybrid sensor histidine kinase/response regulator [Cyanobacteriota bacterium]
LFGEDPGASEATAGDDLGDLFGEDPGASEATAGDDLGGLFEEDSAATGATASGETDWDLDLALDGENDSDAAGAAPDLAFPDDGDDTLLGEEAAPQSGDAEDALEAAFADSAAFADDSDDSLDLGLDLDWEGSSDTGEESDIPSPTATTEDDLDLDLGFDAETADAADDAGDLELDLGFDSASEEEFALDSPNDSEADGDLDLDFGFDLDATPGAEAAIAADSDLGEDDLSTAEFDLNFEEAVADAEAAEFELDFEGLSPDADSDQDLVGDLDLAFDLGDGDASADLSDLDMAAVSLDESRESDGDVNLASSPDPAAEMTMDLWGDDTSPSPTPSPGIAAVAAAGVAAIDDPWAEGEDATVDPDEALAALDNLWDDSASDAVPTDDAGELAADADALFADFDEIEEEGIEVPPATAADAASDDFDDLFGNDGVVEDSVLGLEENADSPLATEAATDLGAADLDDLFGNDAEMAASLDDGTDPFGMDAFGTSADDETDDLEALLSTETGEAEAWGETDDSDLLAVDLLDAGVADLPDISTTPDAIAAEADLDELDALLDDEPTDAIPAADDFDDLDAMLGEASSAADDGFDDLEAMLDDDEPLAAEADTDGSFTALDALLEDEADPETDQESDDEFGDLEKLLEAADQSLGGGSPSIRGGGGGGRTSRRVGAMVDQTMRVSVKHLDTLSNLVGELVVNRNSLEQDQERLRQFLDNLLFQVQQLNDVGQRMRDLYERSLLESSLISSRQAFHAGVSSGGNGGFSQGNGDGEHATGATFDALEMDRFTGFHTLSQEMIELIVRVRESASDIGYTVESSDQITRQFRQVTTQLQEGLNKARMVPFAQTADRLPRAVRDISLKCGKEARLVVEGRDTLIDKMILERLYDPMTHLVNNAITHGIEPPEERVAAGKPREGTITVRAFYQGNQTVIYIADDGAGINTDVVKQKAIKKGLITQAEARSMSELETHDLLFRPGFSTRDQADDFAGRGVGMDVVRTALSEIRGAITIDSTMGKGTGFTIRLPLTLSISKALSCLNNQARIAFPMDGVEDMFDVPKERVQTDAQGRNNILWRDTQLTFQPLSDLLQFSRTLGRGRVYGGSQDDDMVSIVVLRNANTYIGLQVDRVLGEQEIVIKQLEGPVPKPAGIAGATVLGDGRVMPIADVLELIDLAQGRVRRESTASLWAQDAEPPAEEAEAVKAEPTVLIVDDSITVRELLSMSFNKVGYRVEQARDGQEAWEKLRSGLPCDLVFCDIEMPRMDGLELLSRMQKDGVLKHVPIAMLTSRGADRHRQMALDLGASGYFTKPYLEEALLDAAQRMLKGEVLLHPTKDKEE